jgi:hypothetical protein
MITRVRMDGQRRIRIPKKAGLEGDTFLLLSLGKYHIIFPVPEEKPELEIEGPITELLAQAEEEASQDISRRWKRRGVQSAD